MAFGCMDITLHVYVLQLILQSAEGTEKQNSEHTFFIQTQSRPVASPLSYVPNLPSPLPPPAPVKIGQVKK